MFDLRKLKPGSIIQGKLNPRCYGIALGNDKYYLMFDPKTFKHQIWVLTPGVNYNTHAWKILVEIP